MLLDLLERRLAEREAQSLRRRRRVAESPCAPLQTVSADADSAARPMLAFCSNDYLGLANHPALAAALAEGAALYGTGSGASHLINGHSRAHVALEDELARWLAPHIPQARVLSFSTGYMANLAVLAGLGRVGDDSHGVTIFSEALNHASLIDGARLARARVQRYPHADVHSLKRQLADCSTALKIIVTDAVFSMDGDIAPLPELLALAEQHDAWLVVDDAHGFGVLGAQGRGSLAHFGLRSERLVYMGTLGKAAGVAGAFVAAHATVAEWLLQTARPYIFTTAAPPALAHALLTSLALIAGADGQARRQHLQALIERLRTRLPAALGRSPWRLVPSHTAVQPLIVGDNTRALALAAALDAQGLWVPAIRPPTVPEGTARLRITLSAAHTVQQVDQLIDALAACSSVLVSAPVAEQPA